MEKAPPDILRSELLAALSATTSRLCDALRAELARPIRLQRGHPLQFEADPFSYSIHSCATEEGLIGNWLDAALPHDWFERAEEVLGGWDEVVWAELCPWFADCWQAVGGPARFSPAFLFFHGYHLDQYDLEHRRWLSAAEAVSGCQ